MNELKVFEHPEFGKIRTVEIDGKVWLVGRDVARALGYTNPQAAVQKRVNAECKGVSKILTSGGKQNVIIINKEGLYALFLFSKHPNAQKIKNWIESDVPPQLHSEQVESGRTYESSLFDAITEEKDVNTEEKVSETTDIILYENEEFGSIRGVEIDGEAWLVGKDVATVLGYVDTDQALRKHIDEEDKLTRQFNGSGQNRDMIVINESGLYSLALSSKLPGAKKFRRWVTKEVLPSIRKHGAYITPDTLEQIINSPEFGIRLLTALKEEQEKRKKLESDVQIMQPKADYFDELVDRNLLTNFRDTAKQFHMKQNTFIAFLLEKKYIYRDKSGKLLPYQQYVDKGLFELKERFNDKSGWAGTQTLITPKGRETFKLLCSPAA